jgi:hypothetical protein
MWRMELDRWSLFILYKTYHSNTLEGKLITLLPLSSLLLPSLILPFLPQVLSMVRGKETKVVEANGSIL